MADAAPQVTSSGSLGRARSLGAVAALQSLADAHAARSVPAQLAVVAQANGKDKQGDEDKKKGDDYCNNVGKLLRTLDGLVPGLITAAVQAEIDRIDSNRHKCSVSTHLVQGADLNTKAYGEFAARLTGLIQQIVPLLSESDRNYYLKTFKGLIPGILAQFDALPQTCVDPRVAEVVRDGTEGDGRAVAVIDGALQALVQLLKDALRAIYTAHVPDAPIRKNKGPPPPPPSGGAGAPGGGNVVDPVGG